MLCCHIDDGEVSDHSIEIPLISPICGRCVFIDVAIIPQRWERVQIANRVSDVRSLNKIELNIFRLNCTDNAISCNVVCPCTGQVCKKTDLKPIKLCVTSKS